MDEIQRLDNAAQNFSTFGGAEGMTVKCGYESIEQWLVGSTCLELGPADGMLTEQLRKKFQSVISVEGSLTFAETLRSSLGEDQDYKIICSLFEDYTPESKFDSIVAARIMEHVDDPVALYSRMRDWINPGGVLIIQVPNALSFHRLLGVKMGMLQTPYELNERDIKVGHRRVYDREVLEKQAVDSGWKVTGFLGTFFKLFSNDQMDQWFTEPQMDGFNKLGEEFQDNAALISIRCEL